MGNIHNCSNCDYCYSNETMKGGTYLCVNFGSECFGQPVDWLGLSEENMECVVENGKSFDELVKENEDDL